MKDSIYEIIRNINNEDGTASRKESVGYLKTLQDCFSWLSKNKCTELDSGRFRTPSPGDNIRVSYTIKPIEQVKFLEL